MLTGAACICAASADLPERYPEGLSASTYTPPESHRLVFQAKT